MRIAICGKLRSGKDVLANELIENYGFKGFKFSSGITNIINDYFTEEAIKGRKMREHYQRIGQTLRGLDQNVWVNYTKSQIENYLEQNGSRSDILVSDLRQKNEYKFLKENGFIVIKVESDEDIRIGRAMAVRDTFHNGALRHETELSVDLIPEDYLITNNGTLEEFKYAIEEVMIEIMVDIIRTHEGNKSRFD